MNDRYGPSPGPMLPPPGIPAPPSHNTPEGFELRLPQLRREEALDWFEREDGLAVLGFRFDSPQGLAREVDWHQHARAQLICVEHGVLTTRTRHGTWSLPAGSGGWMPPAELHTVQVDGPMRGWGMALAPGICGELPADPCVIGISDLLHALARRIGGWHPSPQASGSQQRLIGVLLDEIRDAPRQRMHLPMPQDRRLLRVTSQLLAEPADGRSLAQWAQWAGLSPRSLTRRFREETTLSFAQWRQQARLAEALRQLGDGRSVADIAHALGFSSSSAFVTVFRNHFGLPPGRYLARAGTARPSARGLASPTASG
ncbi:helix-turn-helix transcriptional regulator [Stenotrophomonas sp. Leaf70]|uniref:helix-turn-helix domain-containing protein n=1 Tax=Stenotrophomonas sp. Leaf70 TaxID=1736233 RepID=UPI001F27A807|nr:helix-turn-helix transcriptional regulator [Stenotrophomonas sp. Leaf70]